LSLVPTSSYREVFADRLLAERQALSARWLERLISILPVDGRDVFPGETLLDHIPALMEQIAAYVRAPEDAEIGANAAVIAKAQELGLLRYRQQASVHQLLREYDILAAILEVFAADEATRPTLEPDVTECFAVMRRIGRAVRALMQTTVDTFLAEYTETIARQTEALESFNSMVSHELRNPLSAAQYAAELLLRAEPSHAADAHRRLPALIQRNVLKANELLLDLRNLSRVGPAAETPTIQTIELTSVAQEVARQLREMAAERAVTLRVAPGLVAAETDPARVELILMNLVSNGIKYADPAKEDRFVEMRPLPDGAPGVVVSDNGIGIPAEALPNVFERFVRAHAGRDRELGVDGTGLGLAIAQECAASMDARIEVQSVEGEGTTFAIRLAGGGRA
jgi:signal transduction histidine kinase